MVCCIAEGVNVISYHVFDTLFAGTVPSTVLDMATVLLLLIYCSFHWTSPTSLIFKPLTEPAAASAVVLNFNVAVAIVFPASDVRSNLRKVF